MWSLHVSEYIGLQFIIPFPSFMTPINSSIGKISFLSNSEKSNVKLFNVLSDHPTASCKELALIFVGCKNPLDSNQKRSTALTLARHRNLGLRATAFVLASIQPTIQNIQGEKSQIL